MKEFKVTKGDWELENGDSFNEFETVIFSGKKRVCQVKHFNTGDGDKTFINDPMKKEGLANAKLISAAPDLLEALQAIVKHGEEYGLPNELYFQAKTAINKALD